jgi:hypothetical protein
VTGLLCASTAEAAAPYTTETLRPYLNNEVNALELNRLFLDSMLDMDRIPFTVGTAVRAAPASYQRLDGEVTEAGLGKQLYTLSFGGGRPDSGVGVFAGGIVSNVRPSGFPNIWALSGEGDDLIRAAGSSAVLFAGVGVKGTVVQLAYHRTELGWDADGAGLFVPGGCHLEYGCQSRQPRPGAPVEDPPVAFQQNKHALLINVLNEEGYHTEALISPVSDVTLDGELVRRTALAAARVAGMPEDLFDPKIGLLGAGLNFYDKAVDYYGDRNARVREAVANDEPLPETDSKPMLELPLLASDLANVGIQARLIPQILPRPALRMVEVGWSMEGPLGERLVPQVGTRAKAFKRGTGYEPSVDVYAGALLSYGDLYDEVARGVSVMASYSYNSPDSLTFVPIEGAHVLGIQLIVGNATALPPPVAILRESVND